MNENDESLRNTESDLKIEKGNFTWSGLKQDDDDEKDSKDKSKSTFVSLPLDDSTTGDSSQDEENKQPSVTLSECILLKSLNLEIIKGEFVCIIGEVGSGKSSLINSILGEMVHLDEKTIDELGSSLMNDETRDLICQRNMLHRDIIKLGGSISFVQQTPWIQNQTIRDNILFGLPMNEEEYNKTIDICQLESDLEILRGGDLTEIGEKGINLSGGQKARISLARAVYANRDIILMDDPISALDSNVKHKIFEEVF